MKKTLCAFLLLTATVWSQPVLFTDHRQLPRDLRVSQPVRPVDPALFDSVPWEAVQPGSRRKVLFNDRMTMVLLEIDQPVDDKPLQTHYHVHDQITYLLEGRGRVRVGQEEREVGAGAAYVAPSNVHHGLKPLTQRLVLVECFTPTREDFRPGPAAPPSQVGANDIRSFVYNWFALLDRNALPEELLVHLAAQDLEMTFPEGPLRSPEEFRRWYQGILQNFSGASHVVESLQVEPDGKAWRVRLRVGWTPVPRQGGAVATRWFRQEWKVEIIGGFPQIVRYQVQPDSV